MSIDYAELARLAKKGRRAEQASKVYKGCLTALFTTVSVNAFQAYMFMLAIGIVHAEWWPAVPTIGYWWSLLVVFLVRGVFSPLPKTSKEKS